MGCESSTCRRKFTGSTRDLSRKKKEGTLVAIAKRALIVGGAIYAFHIFLLILVENDVVNVEFFDKLESFADRLTRWLPVKLMLPSLIDLLVGNAFVYCVISFSVFLVLWAWGQLKTRNSHGKKQ